MAVSYITVVDDGLALSYAVLAVAALIQLARIHLRLPHVTWTTQKVFQCLIIVTASLRAAVFACRSEVEEAVREAYPFMYEVLLDGPGLLFFSTFTLLILFWAEIYYQATVTSRLGEGGEDGGAGREANPPQKRVFLLANVVAYAAFVGIAWRQTAADGDAEPPAPAPAPESSPSASPPASPSSSSPFLLLTLFALLAVVTAYLFLLYGARLFMLLRRFPIDSRGRRSKLLEIGLITSIACVCFTARAVLLVQAAVDADGRFGGLDVMSHPVLNGVYYMVCEVLPLGLVMWILRKLPPKKERRVGVGRVRVGGAASGEREREQDHEQERTREGDDVDDVDDDDDVDVESAGAFAGPDVEEPLLS